MPILRYINGRFDQKAVLRQKIRYLDDPLKQIWNGEALPRALMTGGYGVDFSTAYETFLGLHAAYGFKGTRLFYHLLLDFEPGLLDPFRVCEIAYQECEYLQTLNAMFIWGVHCTPRPHMHVVVNSILPLTGYKLQIKKKNIFWHKVMANRVLHHYNLPLIDMWLPEDWKDDEDERCLF